MRAIPIILKISDFQKRDFVLAFAPGSADCVAGLPGTGAGRAVGAQPPAALQLTHAAASCLCALTPEATDQPSAREGSWRVLREPTPHPGRLPLGAPEEGLGSDGSRCLTKQTRGRGPGLAGWALSSLLQAGLGSPPLPGFPCGNVPSPHALHGDRTAAARVPAPLWEQVGRVRAEGWRVDSSHPECADS